MRSGEIILTAMAICAALGGASAHAQEKLVMNEIAPWVKDDISIEPRLLTLRDVEDQLGDASPISPKAKKKNIGSRSAREDDDREEDSVSGLPEKSPLEKMYSSRVVDEVRQFGYDLFASENRKKDRYDAPAGAVQDDFILNIGDELSVVMRGQKQDRQSSVISSEGMLVIDDLAPIPAAGRSLGDVREQLKSEVSKLYNTEVFLSLSRVNQVNVLVIGHVNRPGRQTMTSFDTILDALMAAGGIEKTGTLRQIRVVRDGKTMLIDLYGLLVFGSEAMDIALRNGDKIIVRPIGPTIAVAGDVKRPGIYEILPALKANWDRPEEKSQKLSMNDLLSMAGGVVSPAAHRYLRMDITEKGDERVEEVSDVFARVFSDGDILNIARGKERREGTVELIGNANQSGIHSLAETETLSALLYDDSVVGPETYPLIGVIEHWNRQQMAKELIAFVPRLVLNGEYDHKLESNDAVYLFSQKQIEKLKKPDPQAELIEASMGGSAEELEDTPRITKSMRKFLIERSLFVRGAVRNPGAYPVAEGVTLDSVLAIAGGTTLEGNTQNIEVTSDQLGESHQKNGRSGTQRETFNLAETDPRDIRLSSGDTVRVNQKFRRVEDNHVLLVGEVKNPGTYDLQPGDTLGRLMMRAGGITNDSYAEGTIFSRQSERKREESRFKSQAQDLEMKLAAMLQQDDKDKKPDPQNVAVAKELITQLKGAEALGRITVEADPGILKSQPQLDILLENGDRIYVPKRPLTVRVAGEVLSPASLQFRTEKKPRDYINEAGGMSYNADDGRAFVVYPDGSAQPLAVSSWNHNPVFIPPGSTIVVPRDPKPLTFIDGAKDISQILANVATAAIFADDLRDDN